MDLLDWIKNDPLAQEALELMTLEEREVADAFVREHLQELMEAFVKFVEQHEADGASGRQKPPLC
jgi:phytoene/squalene synthetase